MIAAAAAGKAIFCEKPISLDLGKVDEALAAVDGQRRADPDRLQPSLRSGTRVGTCRGRRRIGRRPAHRADHQPRPGAAADRLHQGVGRNVPRHDDPRLRHGPVRHGQRGGRCVRPGRRACRSGDRRGRRCRHGGRHAAPRERLHHDDRQQSPGRVRLRPARRGIRFGRPRCVGEPVEPHRHPPDSRRRRSARRFRTSSSSGTSRATSRNGRRSSATSPTAGRRRSRPTTAERRW